MNNFVIFSLALAGILNSISIIKINNKINEIQSVIVFLTKINLDDTLKEDLKEYLKESK